MLRLKNGESIMTRSIWKDITKKMKTEDIIGIPYPDQAYKIR